VETPAGLDHEATGLGRFSEGDDRNARMLDDRGSNLLPAPVHQLDNLAREPGLQQNFD
jgi:hypothetical protein